MSSLMSKISASISRCQTKGLSVQAVMLGQQTKRALYNEMADHQRKNYTLTTGIDGKVVNAHGPSEPIPGGYQKIYLYNIPVIDADLDGILVGL